MTETHSSLAGMVFMVMVLNRDRGEKMAAYCTEHNVRFNFLALGRGTVNSKILSYLGIADNRKDILYSTASEKEARELLQNVAQSEYNLDKPGEGVAFCVPINNAAFEKLLACQSKNAAGLEGACMELPYQHDLIIAVTALGYADEVMETARSAGATGGTILRTRGAGAKEADKFFGVTIQSEKEFLFIVTETAKRKGIMSAIVARHGLHTDAGAIVFSLPVSAVAGMRFDAPESDEKG